MNPMKFFSKIIFLIFFLSSSAVVFAEELKIVFTGQSYASLYPCDCPLDRVGGLARRATAINMIRSASKDVLVLEAGSSFGFDEKDPSKQDYDTDRRRTSFYLDGLKRMGYDALLAEPQEFIFGLEFLEGMPFVVSNLEGFKNTFIIKDFNWIKVGIIGFCDVVQEDDHGLKWIAPSSVLKKTIVALKKSGVDFIILLSHLNPQEDEELLKRLKGIDLVINGGHFLGSVAMEEVCGAMYLKTSWLAKNLGVLTLDFKGKKIHGKKLDSVRLNDALKDDRGIQDLLPACFQGGDCARRGLGFEAECRDAGTKLAQCVYMPVPKVRLRIIRPAVCHTCRPDVIIENFNKVFPNLDVQYLAEDDKIAQAIMKAFDIKMLPAYVFDKDISGLKQFDTVKEFLIEGKENYLLKPSESGVSFLLGRARIPKRLDVFFDFSYTQGPELFYLLKAFREKHKDYDVHLNFIIVRDKEGKPMSRGGDSEIEEFRRVACLDKLYGAGLFDYLICRSSRKGLSWWGECAQGLNIETMRIKECVVSRDGRAAFDGHVALSGELEIVNGPAFIIENKEIFSIVNVPSLEEFEKTVIGATQKK